jgi:AGZA family xanthine/uracil permease-like MFS transporter
LVIAVLAHFNVKGAVIIGILVATLFGLIPGIDVTVWSNQSWKFWENFSGFFAFDSAEGGTFFAAFTEGFNFPAGVSIMSLVMVTITFCMIDMFDTMGTVVGCCVPVGLADENNKPFNYNGIMMSDSIATCAGALFGTSTVTSFVESGSGVAAGGRTGLTALSTAICFLLAIFLFPLIASIPGPAAAAALLYVGCLMLKGIKNINVDGVKNAVPAFLTIAMMPLAYSITDGIGFGILSYVIINICCYVVDVIKYACAKNKETAVKPVWDLHVVTIIIAVLFLVYFFVPTTF